MSLDFFFFNHLPSPPLSYLYVEQDFSVRLAEGEALQSFAERAMAWQDRVQDVLASSEICNTLAELLGTCRRGIAGTRSSTRKVGQAGRFAF